MSIASAPNTTVYPDQGVVTFGNLTLAFHLAPGEDDSRTQAQQSVPLAPERPVASGEAAADEAALQEIALAYTGALLQAVEQHNQRSSGRGDKPGAEHISASAARGDDAITDRPLSSARRLHSVMKAVEAAGGSKSSEGAGGGSGSGKKLGTHLFTVGITGAMRASRLKLEPDTPARPDSYRLGVTMELILDSLRIKVALNTLNFLACSRHKMER